jgi:uncharacterized repeat protein (TIGR03803 family)
LPAAAGSIQETREPAYALSPAADLIGGVIAPLQFAVETTVAARETIRITVPDMRHIITRSMHDFLVALSKVLRSKKRSRAYMRYVSCVVALFCIACSGCSRMGATPQMPWSPEGSQVRSLTQSPFKVLYRFRGHLDGARPQAEPIEVSGTFYGTTSEGGSNPKQCFCGTVYSVDATGRETVLYQFKGNGDGASPQGSLAYVKGTLYGTTFSGGSGPCGGGYQAGCGTLFTLDASGHERVVHRFDSSPDGSRPMGKLVALNGKLFGTTMSGGLLSCGCGTVFVFDPSSGREKVIYSFTGGKDGTAPLAGLTLVGKDLYGTTSGNRCAGGSCGSVFRIDPSGTFHVVHAFTGNDGNYPASNPVQVGATLYGTTYYGGNGCFVSGCGTIYAIDKSGNAHTVWLFGVGRDGTAPVGHLAVLHGEIYGTTQEGGDGACYRNYGCGTVFRFDPSTLRETKLHAFTPSEGASPLSGVIERGGALYGTADVGAMRSWGSVFWLAPSL